MKKLCKFILPIITTLVLFAGCDKKQKTQQATVTSENAAYYDKMTGVTLPALTGTFEEYQNNISFSSDVGSVSEDTSKNVALLYSYVMFPVEGKNIEEVKSWADISCYAYIGAVAFPKEDRSFDDGEIEKFLESEEEDPSSYTKDTMSNGKEAYFAVIDQTSGTPTEEQQKVIDTLRVEYKELYKTAIILDAVDTSLKHLSFETTDFDGNKVSSAELFAKADATFVNIWASWCGPCASELPDLQELSDMAKAKNAQVVLILQDGTDLEDDEVETAKAILAKKGVNLTCLLWDKAIEEQINLLCFPTSYVVDSQGNGVGEAFLGTHSAAQYMLGIDKALSSK